MNSRTATALTLALAAASLFLPRWLYGGAEAGSRSALRFEILSHDFGEVLEGHEVVFEFPFENTADRPLKIERVRHCGCIHLERPRKAIQPGETGVIRMRLDSRNRTGRQVKPIDLFTDEAEGGEAKLVVTGMVRSPLILRTSRILVQDALPGQSTAHNLEVLANDDVADVAVGPLDGDFLEANLTQADDDQWELAVNVRAPAEAGALSGSVSLTCTADGESWTKIIPVRVVVPQPFRTLPPRGVTVRGGSGTLNVMTDDPAKGKVTGFDATDPGLVVTEVRRNDRMLTLKVSLAGGVAVVADDAHVRITTDHPVVTEILVPVEVVDD